MLQKTRIIILGLMLGLFSSNSALAQQDVKGSKDHPMISPYEGSFIYLYDHSDYNRIEIPWKMEDRDVQDTAVEGEITHIFYAAPEGLSAFQVHKNYMMALQDAGFEIIYECASGKDKCGRLFRNFEAIDDQWEIFVGNDHSYFVARLEDPAGDMIVTARTVLHTHYGELKQRPVTELQIIEEKSMQTGMVDVNPNAEAMAKDIENTGKVRIYGIHFDVNKATIKSESASVLSEITALLKDNVDLSLLVVGHTDATGGLEHNMELSRERAEAVVDYLTTNHGVSAERLEPHGVGYLAPVATNETEEGRARNRRVELVKLY
ncbi:MAG: OmpA family protein [Bacteroidales bacterium]|nr:OmpA family protein [Bacteroidales bacterium]MCF8343157.1 OmpA family protein [Bacteroidales bacterium]MCF8351086.1 OmpA family protein [Bacteroidales bacterium]MCF8376816.1 OmpA family protein [Bacteroidales bacterium]MCF8400723.1 OmpA family protein [Bacteroidales bacterium]